MVSLSVALDVSGKYLLLQPLLHVASPSATCC